MQQLRSPEMLLISENQLNFRRKSCLVALYMHLHHYSDCAQRLRGLASLAARGPFVFHYLGCTIQLRATTTTTTTATFGLACSLGDSLGLG